MTEIGPEHGIVGFTNFLRTYGDWQRHFVEWVNTNQARLVEIGLTPPPIPPKLGTRGPAYDPENLKTWPMVDKIQRTWETLVADHDSETPDPNPPGAGIFDARWAFVRDPRSGYETEKIAALKQAGYTTIALNVADHSPASWEGWRELAGALNVIPWGRCSTVAQAHALGGCAVDWFAKGAIANLEQEMSEPRWLATGAEFAAALQIVPGEVGISTESWMPENFDWGPLIAMGCVCLPQSLVNENPSFTPAAVVERARLFGWPKIIPSFGVYKTDIRPIRFDYPWGGPFGIYPLDDLLPAEIASWA